MAIVGTSNWLVIGSIEEAVDELPMVFIPGELEALMPALDPPALGRPLLVDLATLIPPLLDALVTLAPPLLDDLATPGPPLLVDSPTFPPPRAVAAFEAVSDALQPIKNGKKVSKGEQIR